MVDDFFGSYSGGDVAPEIDENVFDPTYGGYFGEVGGENVFDPTYGGYFGEVAGENVFDPTYGGTLPSDTGGGATRGLSPVPKVGTGGAKTPPPPSSAISSILKQLFVDDKGNLNLKTLGGVGGGILGALGANTPNRQKSGYQGSIPKFDAVRNMVTAPPTRAQGYRPGQGGINYGGDVSYVPRGSASAAPSSGGGSSGLGDLAKIAGLGGLGYMASKFLTGDNSPFNGMARAGDGLIPAIADGSGGSLGRSISDSIRQPVSPDDLFYQSPEYKAFQNDPSNMTGTMDMYNSPYFGSVSSGSVGKAMDAAYEKYKGNAPAGAAPTGGIIQEASFPQDFGMAQGGLAGLAKGRYLQGETDGMADKIPAQIGDDQPAALSHGEFVIPADVVSHLGNGNSDAGAKKLYSMMDKIRQARTGTKKQGKQINPDKFMPGGLAQAYAGGGEVMQFNTGGAAGTTGLGTAANAGVTGSETTPNKFAGEYIANMLGQGQALATAPYQQYMGPLTAGESGLQSKVFQGLGNLSFPGNLGQSFSSTGAYQPPQMNMGAYNTQPIGTGPQPGMTLNQGSNGFGDFGSMQGQPDNMMLPQGQLPSSSVLYGQPNMRFATADEAKMQRDPTADDMRSMLANNPFGGQPGQMPQGGLASLAGRMPQQPQQPQGIASQYMNPYLQSVLDPQMAELRRQNEITNMQANAKATGMGAFGGGRQAIMNAENARNLMQEMNKTVGQGYATAYDKGMGQFNIEQAQNMGLARLMADQGAQQRGIEAEGIAADKAAFEAARENPYKMLQFQQSLLQGMPISATNIDVATPTKLQEILSGIGGGVKMVGNKPEDISLKSVTDLLGKLGLGGTPG